MQNRNLCAVNILAFWPSRILALKFVRMKGLPDTLRYRDRLLVP